MNYPIPKNNLSFPLLLVLACQFPEFKGDGPCDDGNNHEGCEYDGGDCCGSNVHTDFCSECQCLDPNYEGKREKDKYRYNKLSSFDNLIQNHKSGYLT